MAILSFLKADSGKTPYQVVKGVMRLAIQLKVRGYKRGSGRHSNHNQSDNDEDDDDGIYGANSMYSFDRDSESDLDGYRSPSQRKARQERIERMRRSRRRQE